MTKIVNVPVSTRTYDKLVKTLNAARRRGGLTRGRPLSKVPLCPVPYHYDLWVRLVRECR